MMALPFALSVCALESTAGMLDHVPVEAYGERQPLSGLAQIALRNPTLLVVNPFDAAVSAPTRWCPDYGLAYALRPSAFASSRSWQAPLPTRSGTRG
jgi:hypothetical protein